jgi:hypothetical protein
MDRIKWLQVIGTGSVLLFVGSLPAAFYGVRFRLWCLAAVGSVLSLPLCLIAHVPSLLLWLVPCLELAAAVAPRWRVDAVGAWALLAMGVIASLVGGPRAILLDGDYGWVLVIGLLVGSIVLAWNRPPWIPVERPQAKH